ASSVDAERAFSVGHRHINFMQHNMSSTSFRAKMALGSWFNTPLFPGLKKASRIIEEAMKDDKFNKEMEEDATSDEPDESD
ncbi:hypothetical protein BKA70DRAFT_1117378, partial [Coprinopsis sp. MPI-PUGE-AT-0042]